MANQKLLFNLWKNKFIRIQINVTLKKKNSMPGFVYFATLPEMYFVYFGTPNLQKK